MQVFCPCLDPFDTVKVLDNRRLNKQILEILQILSVNLNINIDWKIPKYVKNHPNTKLWKNDPLYLIKYLEDLFIEYTKRTNKKHKCEEKLNYFPQGFYLYKNCLILPDFLTSSFCYNHKKLLLEKNYNYYINYFKEFKKV